MTHHPDLVARKLRKQAHILWSSAKIGAITKDRAASAMDEAAALIEAQAAEIAGLREALADPNAVHANMLRGDIALPSVRQMIHIYGPDAVRQEMEGGDV